MNFNEALSHLGVCDETLDRATRDTLDAQGFAVFADSFPKEWLPALRDRFPSLADAKETGTIHVKGLMEDPLVLKACTSPEVLAAAHQLLQRRFYLPDIHGRDPQPGFGQQGLHADWPTGGADRTEVVTAIVLLDDFTKDNGATRRVRSAVSARPRRTRVLGHEPRCPCPPARAVAAGNPG